MACFNPKIAYQRRYFPIDCNQSEKKLKKYNKISFVYKEGWQQIELNCGECPACKLAKANDWATRITCESDTWQNKGIFVTLTYNNPNLPKNKNGIPTLRKRDIQLFKKRLRKYIKKNNEAIHEWKNPITGKIEKPVRTFECGEYGPKNGRPHYHQIIFNWIPNDLVKKQISKDGYPLFTSKTLQKIWGKGFVLIGMISYESASYVARYTMKKNGLAKQKREYYDVCEPDEENGELVMKTKYKNIQGEIESEFITMSTSPGIGYNYFVKNKEKIKNNNGILIKSKGNTSSRPIPRYFRKIWEKLDWQDYHRWKYQNKNRCENNFEKMLKSFNLPEDWLECKKEMWIKNLTLEKQRHKFGLLRRDNITYEEK